MLRNAKRERLRAYKGVASSSTSPDLAC